MYVWCQFCNVFQRHAIGGWVPWAGDVEVVVGPLLVEQTPGRSQVGSSLWHLRRGLHQALAGSGTSFRNTSNAFQLQIERRV
jgi:hypothetical protein